MVQFISYKPLNVEVHNHPWQLISEAHECVSYKVPVKLIVKEWGNVAICKHKTTVKRHWPNQVRTFHLSRCICLLVVQDWKINVIEFLHMINIRFVKKCCRHIVYFSYINRYKGSSFVVGVFMYIDITWRIMPMLLIRCVMPMAYTP